MKPICYDLFCGLDGWGEAFLSEGYEVYGYDIVDMAHEIGVQRKPGLNLILRDVRSIHGSELKDATVIVASPPCQAYRYRAMPWKRAKALPPPDNELFNACFRIQREACEAAGHHIPLIVENVCGAQRWVGPAKWHFGSYYLWGDVPALMPITRRIVKVPNQNWSRFKTHGEPSLHWRLQVNNGIHPDDTGTKCGGDWFSGYGGNFCWNHSQMRQHNSHSIARKRASAEIAKIPFPLAVHIARVFNPIKKENKCRVVA